MRINDTTIVWSKVRDPAFWSGFHSLALVYGVEALTVSLFCDYPRRSNRIQHHMINRLTVQLGLETIAGRNEYIAREVGRTVAHLVDLTQQEAQALIEVLKVELQSRNNDATGASHA